MGAFRDEATSGGSSDEGALHILFMNPNGTVKSTVKISDAENGGPSGLDATDFFGGSVASIGDLDGDGITDLAVGAYADEATSGGSSDEGALHILFMTNTSRLRLATAGTERFSVTNGGLVGIGTSTPQRILSVQETTANSQFRLAYDNTNFSDFQIDSTGDLIFNPSGDDVFLNDDNLWVCSGGACSAGTPAGTGNLIVETRLGIGTSTPNWALQLAGTRPFLTLSDTSAGADLKHWFFSSQGGNLYVGTTTDGYATSSIGALSLFGGSGVLSIGTSTDKLAGLTYSATGTVITQSQIAPMGFPIPFSNVFAITTQLTGNAAQIASSTFIVPAGVYRVWVEVYGGGGAGQDANVVNGGGGGGGAGGVVKGFMDVFPGVSINYALGKGGAQQASAAGQSGGTSHANYGNTWLVASGGEGGTATATGGEGGIGTGGVINSRGGPGGAQTADSAGAGGSNERGGGSRGPLNAGTALQGGVCGGGGGGTETGVAGDGGGGCVFIWY
ncbi:MAG: FG-GAP repeat protein [Candidatus Niyogibacteria bacterium]|nr:FG-GAP repeat protein [Candidatus Niyogibacteria bacterium]